MPIDIVNSSSGTASVTMTNPAPVAPVVQNRPETTQTQRQNLPGSGQSMPSAGESKPAGREEVERAVSQLNDHIQLVRRDLHFTVDDDTGKTVVKVLDSESGDLIRQIPSEEMVAISRAITENMSRVEGLIFREEA